MKQETIKPTNEQINRLMEEARVLRSQELFRLSGKLFRLPMRLLNRTRAAALSSDKGVAQSS
ncbi:MAG: hypothetical protein AB8B84_08965 [Granulosicoccus sp.]